jgi:KDO2-lipid IV(A) lauroyltransferase
MERPAAMRFGRGLGRVACAVLGRDRRRAERNLRFAYGDALSPAERGAITRGVFENLGKTLVDFLRAPGADRGALDRLVPCCEGREHLEAAIRNNRGVIIVTAHLGNWEVLGQWLGARGLPLTVVWNEPADSALRDYLLEMRGRLGMTGVPKRAAARELLRALRRGGGVGLLTDLNSTDVFAPFFGAPAGTAAGPAALALRTGAALLPVYAVRNPDDTYRVLLFPPVEAERAGSPEENVARVTADLNRLLERVVRRYPDQWLWMQDRWRSAFDEKNRARWPEGFDFSAAKARWSGCGTEAPEVRG